MQGAEAQEQRMEGQQHQQQSAARPRVHAIPLDTQPVRVPDGAGGVGLRGKSLFDATVRGPGAQGHQVPIRQAAPAPAPREPAPMVVARPIMGNMEEIRPPAEPRWTPEPPRMGPTVAEAAELSGALADAVRSTRSAAAAGERCGVDGFALRNAGALAERLGSFSRTAAAGARCQDFTAADAALAERVLGEAALHQTAQDGRDGQVAAYVLGGLVVGAIILYAVS